MVPAWVPSVAPEEMWGDSQPCGDMGTRESAGPQAGGEEATSEQGPVGLRAGYPRRGKKGTSGRGTGTVFGVRAAVDVPRGWALAWLHNGNMAGDAFQVGVWFPRSLYAVEGAWTLSAGTTLSMSPCIMHSLSTKFLRENKDAHYTWV